MIDGARIAFQDLGTKGRYVYADGAEAAELTFTKVGTSQIIIDHTEVPTAFRDDGGVLRQAASANVAFAPASMKVRCNAFTAFSRSSLATTNWTSTLRPVSCAEIGLIPASESAVSPFSIMSRPFKSRPITETIPARRVVMRAEG